MTIVGGGLAGLAAAVALAGQGVPVEVLESRDRLGGRASSFADPETGETVDNCQHVSMGCCTNLQHFCRTVGIADRFRIVPSLAFFDPEGRTSTLSAAPLPAPLHLAPAFARLKYLTLGEKFRLAGGLRALARHRPGDADRSQTFRDWLIQHRQSARLIERFWDVVLVSALSESLDRIDVGHARKVFVDGFLRHRLGWQVQVPTVPLDELYGQPVVDWLTRHGGTVRCRAPVRRLHGSCGGVTAVELRDGTQQPVGDVVLAVPQHRVLDLLPADVAAAPPLAGVSQLESAPITSLHLWFDRRITELPQAVLIGRLSQWVFQRQEPETSDGGAPAIAESPPRWAYQVVISASRSLRGAPQTEIRDRVLAELAELWPAAAAAQLVHWRLVTEQRAVFSVVPGVDRLRPVQQSPAANLQLAGDWTATGWPATMEGAVRSGYLAAENVLRRRGLNARLLQPDLPTARLSRWMFGI